MKTLLLWYCRREVYYKNVILKLDYNYVYYKARDCIYKTAYMYYITMQGSCSTTAMY